MSKKNLLAPQGASPRKQSETTQTDNLQSCHIAGNAAGASSFPGGFRGRLSVSLFLVILDDNTL